MKRSCRQCSKQPELKKEWNCEPTKNKDEWIEIYRGTDLKMTLDRCPRAYVKEDQNAEKIMQAYQIYRATDGRVLPFSGGYFEQPKALLDAFIFIVACEAELGEQA